MVMKLNVIAQFNNNASVHRGVRFMDESPETPAHVWALTAVKRSLFGTPGSSPSLVPFMGNNATGAPGADNKGPVEKDQRLVRGILRSPEKSQALTPRKAVSFANGQKEADRKESKSSRFRSGLPRNFPGKFPSPWTPKVAASKCEPSRLRNAINAEASPETVVASVERLPTTGGKEKDLVKLVEEIADSNAHIRQLLDQTEQSFYDEETTVDINSPRSSSGKFWKQKFDALESVRDQLDCQTEQTNTVLEVYRQTGKASEDIRSIDLRLEAAQAKIEQLEAERIKVLGKGKYAMVAGMNEQLDSALAMLDEKDLQMESMQQEKHRQSEELEALKQRAKEMEGLIIEKDALLGTERRRQQDSKIAKEFRDAKREIRDLGLIKLELQNAQGQLSEAEEQIEELKGEQGRLEKELDTSEQEQKELLATHLELEQSLRKQIRELTRDRDSLRQKLGGAKHTDRRIAILRQEVQEKDAVIAALTSENRTLQQQMALSREQIDATKREFKVRMTKANTSITRLKEDLQLKQEKLVDRDLSTQRNLAEERKAFQAKLSELQKQLHKRSKENLFLRDKLRTQVLRMEDLKSHESRTAKKSEEEALRLKRPEEKRDVAKEDAMVFQPLSTNTGPLPPLAADITLQPFKTNRRFSVKKSPAKAAKAVSKKAGKAVMDAARIEAAKQRLEQKRATAVGGVKVHRQLR